METRFWVHIAIVLAGLFSIVQNGYAQTAALGYTYEYWTKEEGIPTNGISDVEALANGYVWLSTYNGLVRFNGLVDSQGEQFTVFNKSNTPGFSTNRLIELKAIGEDEFLLKTEPVGESENLIYFKKGRAHSYGEKDGFRGTIDDFVSDKNRDVWVVNNGKLLRLENGTWIHEYPHLNVGLASGLSINNRDDIWLKNESELWNIKEGELHVIGEEQGLASDYVIDIFRGTNGNVWVATDKGIDLIGSNGVEHIGLPQEEQGELVYRLYEDKTNSERLLMHIRRGQNYAYYKGEFQSIPNDVIEADTGELIDFTLIGDEKYSSGDSNWLSMREYVFHNNKLVFQQKYGDSRYSQSKTKNYWYTEDNKMYRIRKSLFNAYTEGKEGVSNVYAVVKDHEGTIWATGNEEQIFRGKEGESFTRFDLEHNIQSQRQYGMIEDSKGHIWFGLDEAIYVWDRASAPRELELPFTPNDTQFRGILEDKNGVMWFGSRAGVYALNRSLEWKHFPLEESDLEPSIRLIFEDKDDRLWFGTNGKGLLYLNQNSNQLREFEHNDKLSDNIIRSIYQDNEGILWVGTEGSGLNRIEVDQKEPVITHYDQRTGLFGGVIHTILEDDAERFWMSSNQGIFWVRKSELNDYAKGKVSEVTSTVYGVTDGLPGTEANGGVQSSGIITEDGEFLFPMVEGIAAIYPNEVESGIIEVSTRIEGLITNDSSFTYLEDEITLSKEQRDLQFKYLGYNSGINPDNIRFRYILEGYDNDDDWNYVGSRREAFYTSVPAGNYTFVIQASVFGSDWIKSSSSATVSIAPYFYETIVFYLLSTFLIGLIGFLLYRQRIRVLEAREQVLSIKVDEQTSQLKEQAERLQELDKAKSRFFANISHEFRTPLTLTIGPLEDIKKSSEPGISERIRKKANLALRNSKRLLRLVNQILDISKIETGNLAARVSEQDLVGFIQPIGQAFLGLAEKKQIRYNIKLPQHALPFWFDADMMEKIVGNLLSNAFKFTQQQGIITLEVTETEGEQVLIAVSDSGVGIPKEELEHVFERFYQTGESVSTIQAGTGIGLSLVKELVDLHHGEIKVESEIGKGTTFTVLLKKGRTHFEDVQIENSGSLESVSEAIDLSFIEDLGSEVSFDTKPVDEESPGVLLIDDNEEIRGYIKEFIGSKYRVYEAENGKQGLELARTELPDVIICDVMMPVMDGYDFVRQLRNSEETDFIPVMLLTAKAEQSDKLEGLGLGANDYIVKPFDIEEVLLKIDNLIKSQKKIKARFSATSFNLNIEAESVDEQFLKEALKVIEENIDTEDFGVDQFAEAMLVSRAALYARMKEIAGRTPSEFIWDVRLEHAAELLNQNAGNITEVAYSSGFKSVAHFSRSFKKKFDITPRTYLKEKAN